MEGAEGRDELLERCRRGDAGAWNEVVDRYAKLVHSIPRRYGLPDPDCDDVVQTTFVALVTALGRGEIIGRVVPWLATVAHRESWRIGRNRSRALDLADFESLAEPNAAALQGSEDEQSVREALAKLGDSCRELLTALFSVSGEPHYPTIAAQLGMPVGSIGPTRARCLEKLATILADSGIWHGSDRSHPR